MKHFLIDKIKYDGKIVTNIFKRYSFLDRFKENIKFYFDYDLLDGERPEDVSDEIYGTPNHWWVLLLFNEVVDPFYGWLMTYQQIELYAKKLITDTYGTQSEYIGGGGTKEEWDGYLQNKRDELINTNEEKRTIKILKPEYMGIVINQIRKGL